MRASVNSEGTQLTLPLPETSRSTSARGDSSFSDPAFSSNKNLPIHRWVPWIAGFSSQFVRGVLSRYLERKSVILDPFCGVGTTLVEALLLGHDAVGFEINPYAALGSRMKVNAHRVKINSLCDETARFEEFYQEKTSSGHVPLSTPPKGFKTRASFYSPKVLRKVLILTDFVRTIKDPQVQDLFRLAFASTMVAYSNYSYEPSLGRRVSAGKGEIHDFAVGRALSLKLREMAADVRWFQSRVAGKERSVKVINDSFFKYRTHLRPESVDLIVTSPPYLNNYHYNRNTRPHLYWLGYVQHPKDLKILEESNFGKYWQTVRGLEKVDLQFSLPGTDLRERLEALRKRTPERGVYGGRGWANYAASYFNDCYKFAHGINYVLKPGGTALVVMGNSILQGVLIRTDQYFGKIAESVGLELVGIDVPRAARVGNSIIRSEVRVRRAKDSHRLYEAIVELRKH